MRLFISYSRDDKNYVYTLETELRQDYAVWIDKQLVGGTQWWESILTEIESCDCVIAILSPRAVSSIFCAAELEYALALNKPVIPLLLKTCDYPVSLNSRQIQYIDISSALDLQRVLRLLERAIGRLQLEIERGKYAVPHPQPPRPSLPEPKPNEPEHAYEIFAAAEEAAAQNNHTLAESLFNKVMKADPHGLGIAAAERLAEIRLERDRATAYLNVARLAANPATLKGAQAAWGAYVQKFGADHDPQNLSSRLGNLPSANPPNRVGIVGELEVKHIPVVSTPKPVPSLILPDLSTILPQPFDWCPIPAGKVTIEYADSDHKTFDVSAFAIAKYPITNAQYQVFMTVDDGYSDPRWWDYSDHAKLWRKDNRRTKNTSYQGDFIPRVNVSWYEAIAFTRWLTVHLFPSSKLERGLGGEVNIVLPTEQQWQRAAQGDDNRTYPWGNKFDKTRCNTLEIGIGQPTPVTQYPSGASPFGVFGLSGNIWEWCLTTSSGDSIELTGDSRRVVRGGSWNFSRVLARAASRSNSRPVHRGLNIGFRVVCRLPSP